MRILLVEDEHSLRRTLESGLQAACFAVDATDDGAKGSQLARINQYDLIILDNNLPKKCGLEICREIRTKNTAVKIIIMSVIAEIPTKIDLFNAGADDYIVKPVVFAELLARIRALLRRSDTLIPEKITIGDLTIDSNLHRVWQRDKEIKLTPKEFMILEYMAQHRGQVITRLVLLEHVWEESADLFSKAIETHILNLRRKLHQGHKIIHTVVGQGYRLG